MGETKLDYNNINMKHLLSTNKKQLLILFLMLAISLTGFSQQALTLEQALSVAESNSPTIKKTRLNLIRNQENLNAQNAALKSNFSLSINPIGYNQSRDFNDLISKWNSRKTTQSFGCLLYTSPSPR